MKRDKRSLLAKAGIWVQRYFSEWSTPNSQIDCLKEGYVAGYRAALRAAKKGKRENTRT